MVRNAERKLKQSLIAKLNKKTKRDEEQVLYYGVECIQSPKEKSSDSNKEKEREKEVSPLAYSHEKDHL